MGYRYCALFIYILTLYSCKKEQPIETSPVVDTIIDCSIPRIRDSIAAIENVIIHQYIKDSSLLVDSTSTGIYYAIIDTGIGNYPLLNSYIYVYYKGYFTSGRIFDQSLHTLATAFFLNQLIYGWQYGIPLIKKGGKIKLIIPSRLGYGCQTLSGVPANSILVFDIELVDFQ